MENKTININETPEMVNTKDDIEYKILSERGTEIDLPEGALHIKDGKYIHAKHSKELNATVLRKVIVPRHTMDSVFQCNKHIAELVYKLFPDGIFVVTRLKLIDQDPEGLAKIQDIIFDKCYNEAAKIILATFGVADKEEANNFFSDLSHLDFIDLFITIVEQEFNGERTEAILKKVQRVLAERFRLENVVPELADSLAEPLQKLLVASQQNNS